VFDLRGTYPNLRRWLVTLVVSLIALFSSDYVSYNQSFQDGPNEVKASGTEFDANSITPMSRTTIKTVAEATSGLEVNTSFTNAYAATSGDWPMAAANPQRTGWTPEEVRGQLKPVWYKTIEPYISQKVQIIAANDTLYISTARGLYAINSETGADKWVYPTELPLGHSPTYHETAIFARHPKRIYVGGFDHKIHCIDADTGEGIWTYEGEAGFHTNPLVVELENRIIIYAGNRDRYEYAIQDSNNSATLLWRYETGGPVLFSTAMSQDTQTVYFASNDSYAYALNARTGQLVWRSAKLPGAGFHSWWPVVYEDKVIFAGSQNYRVNIDPFRDPLHRLQEDIFRNLPIDAPLAPYGQEPGHWADGTRTIEATRITNYYEEKPWRRTYFVLIQATGQEFTFDSDRDGKPEYAPILWFASHSGNRQPPIVGGDGVLYQTNVYRNHYIPQGHISGWKVGTPIISVITDGVIPEDEPPAYSAGGNLIYWKHFEKGVGSIDISVANGTQWGLGGYDTIQTIMPGFGEMTTGGSYGGSDGSYANRNGDDSPMIPYQGKVYMQKDNTIVAWGDYAGPPTKAPTAYTQYVQNANNASPSVNELKAKLQEEVQKIVGSGHLKPGYFSNGHFDLPATAGLGDYFNDYWHLPSDTIETLIRAAPHLTPDLQQAVKTYVGAEFALYPPYSITHTGWRDGIGRQAFDLPPEVENAIGNFGPSSDRNWVGGFPGWNYPPDVFYAVWKYAEMFGGAETLYNDSRGRFTEIFNNQTNNVPDSTLQLLPYAHNAYIKGYIGYLELEKLAGQPESRDVRAELNRLLALRAANFSKVNNARSSSYGYGRVMAAARNFMYITPELGDYLHRNAFDKVRGTVDFYNRVTPYWFVGKAEENAIEGALRPLYDVNIFQAKALILKEPREELVKYLDVPAFERGDLFYIQNLVAAIEATSVAANRYPVYLPLIFKDSDSVL
jgi:outer membrane protein assembly factor BamB